MDRVKSKETSGDGSVWRFRREVTLGTLLQLVVLLAMVMASWSNLQRELAVIHRDLTQLIESNREQLQRIETLVRRVEHHEYRLGRIEAEVDERGVRLNHPQTSLGVALGF